MARGYLYYLLHEDKLSRIGDRIKNRTQIQDKLGIDLSDDDESYPFRGPDVMRAIEEDPVDLEIGETEGLSVIDNKLDSFDPWSEFR